MAFFDLQLKKSPVSKFEAEPWFLKQIFLKMTLLEFEYRIDFFPFQQINPL